MGRQGAGRDPLRGDRRYRDALYRMTAVAGGPLRGCPQEVTGSRRGLYASVESERSSADSTEWIQGCGAARGVQNPPACPKWAARVLDESVRDGFDGKGTSVPRTDRDPPKGMEMFTWRVEKHPHGRLRREWCESELQVYISDR